jgi:peptidoglycan/LPS O-acetylase OafA/YrhL
VTSADRAHTRAPAVPVLVVAASLVAAEALALLGVGASVVVGSDPGRLALDITTTVFFLLYGVGLLVCARGLLRRRRWARAPVVLAQLIQALVAWSFYPGQTRWLALLLAGTAVVALVAVLSPPATRALVDVREDSA